MRAALVVAALLATACGDDPPPAQESGDPGFDIILPDTGAYSPDAGVTYDAGETDPKAQDTITDTGPPPTPDAGPAVEDTGPAVVDTGPPEDVPCVPSCEGKDCGTDGCDGTCGECESGDLCTAGVCSPDPSAGCEGLDLAEQWAGKFSGKGDFSIVGVIPIEFKTSGDMSFEIKCFNSKLIVSGEMTGEASDNPFTLKMSGTFNPETGVITAKLLEGEVIVYGGLLSYQFDGEAEATLNEEGTFDGTWSVESFDGQVLGGVIPAKDLLPLKAAGTLNAAPI